MPLNSLPAFATGVDPAVPRTVTQKMVRFRGAMFVLAGLGLVALLLDYLTGWQRVAFSDGASARSNPLTLATLFFAFVATAMQKPLRSTSRIERGAWLAVAAMSALFPFSDRIADAVLGQGDWGRMGANTALACGLVAASQLLRLGHRRLALACILGAASIIAIALSGYLMQQTHFHGEMAVTTVLVLLPLCLANTVRFARHPSVVPLLRDDPAGRLLRQHLLIWVILFCAMPVLIGMDLDIVASIYPILHTLQVLIGFLAILYFGQKQLTLLTRARQEERRMVENLSKDALTGVSTRKAAIDWFDRVSGDAPVGLIIVDLDHFKAVNDTYGHLAGDIVLKNVAHVLRSNLRLSDLVVRWGGEEFLIAARVPDAEALYRLAEDLRSAVAQVTSGPDATGQITASFGAILVDPRSDPSLDDCVAVADAALYRAKFLGRNRVILAGQGRGRPTGSAQGLRVVN